MNPAATTFKLLPPETSAYKAGRLLAKLLALVGVLIAVGGVIGAMAMANALGPYASSGMRFAAVLNGVSYVFGGLMVVLSALLAEAVFDIADGAGRGADAGGGHG